MIRVLVVDDHAIVRRGLAEVLSEAADIEVRGEAGSAEETIQALRRGIWDAVVLDLNLPDRNGLDLLGDLKREWPELPVLVLTICSEEQFAVRALRVGASAYLTKASAPDELVRAVRKVVGGGRYVGPELAERLAALVMKDTDANPHDRLSDREYQVFRMLASGRTVAQAGEQLNLSGKTISTYRARVLEKLGLRTNAELTLYAVRNQLLG
jgi:DNA-binding NarL/FixJ family response regulator